MSQQQQQQNAGASSPPPPPPPHRSVPIDIPLRRDAAGGSSSRSPSGGGGSPSSGSSSSSFSSSPRRTSSPRCRSKGCTDKALKTIGDCRLCNFKFCGKHRLPEAHGCAQFESLKQESFERNQKDLMDGKCVASKVDK